MAKALGEHSTARLRKTLRNCAGAIRQAGQSRAHAVPMAAQRGRWIYGTVNKRAE